MPRDPRWTRAFGAEVRAARTYAELTQVELAERIHVHRTTIAHIERGAQDVPLHIAILIAATLVVPLDDLIKGVERRLDSQAPSRPRSR